MSEAISKKEVYEFGPFRLNVVERVLTRGHQVVPLTPKAFDTLVVLLHHSAIAEAASESTHLIVGG